MSKVAVIWSSPNTDGLTASAKNMFVNGLKKAGAEVEEIHLNKKKIDLVFEQFWTIFSVVHLLKLNQRLGM